MEDNALIREPPRQSNPEQGADGAPPARAFERAPFEAPDGRIAALRFPADAPSRRMLFCHANGFCASAYLKAFNALPPDMEILALDLRGHGRTDLPADPARHRSWDVYASDINAVVDQIGDSGPRWTFAGHSMGAVAALLAAAKRTDVAALRLIEPVIMPDAYRAMAHTPFMKFLFRRSGIVKGALGRRARWPDRAAALTSYRGKPLFQSWPDGVLEDYLMDGLEDADGGASLSCAPAWEAANFMSHAHEPLRAARDFIASGGAISALAAGEKSTLSPGPRRRLRQFGAHVTVLPGVGHLLAMERPAAAAAFLAGEPVGEAEA